MSREKEPYPPEEYWQAVRDDYKQSGEHLRHELEDIGALLAYSALGIQSLAAILFGLQYHFAVGIGLVLVSWFNVFVLFPKWTRDVEDGRSVIADRMPLYARDPMAFYAAAHTKIYGLDKIRKKD